jgi:ATP-dependent Clp protease ATP-binding subunit ClpA
MIPLELELSDAALEFLVEQCYDPAMGARPARRAIQRLLRNPASLILAREEIGEGDTVAVTVRDGVLELAKAGLGPRERAAI